MKKYSGPVGTLWTFRVIDIEVEASKKLLSGFSLSEPSFMSFMCCSYNCSTSFLHQCWLKWYVTYSFMENGNKKPLQTELPLRVARALRDRKSEWKNHFNSSLSVFFFFLNFCSCRDTIKKTKTSLPSGGQRQRWQLKLLISGTDWRISER